MKYTPFLRTLSELDESDLNTLVNNSISEGWYVEYKQDIPRKESTIDKDKIVKSVSAFANTKGGWLFYGVQSNDKNIATNISGIDFSSYKNLPDQISAIISDNITPKPLFHLKTVELNNGNGVIIVNVEDSPTPPYITSRGVIYQRENNLCKPICDRYILEKLAEKSEEYYESIEQFCKMEYGETKGQSESNQSYLELYFFPLPFDYFRFDDFYNSQFFNRVALHFYEGEYFLVKADDESSYSIPLSLGFNSIYSSEDSLIIRPITENNFIYKSTTVELLSNGGLKFLIPLFEFDLSNIPNHFKSTPIIDYLQNIFSPSPTTDESDSGFFRLNYDTNNPKPASRQAQSDFINHIKMIDGSELILDILIIISKYKAILKDCSYDFKNKIGFRARVTETWRKFIIFDNEQYLENIKLYNLPLSPKVKIETPKFVKRNYYELDISEKDIIFQVALVILHAIGLPDSSTIKIEDIVNHGLLKRFPKEN